jgi:hypothetical protein
MTKATRLTGTFSEGQHNETPNSRSNGCANNLPDVGGSTFLLIGKGLQTTARIFGGALLSAKNLARKSIWQRVYWLS